MGRQKYAGSCGIYVFVSPVPSQISDGSEELWLLVHRRSHAIPEPLLISAPGGRVLRGQGKLEERAQSTALQELAEETGIKLNVSAQELDMHVSESDTHLNFSVLLDYFPIVPGPEARYRFEIKEDGVRNIRDAKPAGDGFHAWIEVKTLLQQQDLLPGCRDMVSVFWRNWLRQTSKRSPIGGAGARAATEELSRTSCLKSLDIRSTNLTEDGKDAMLQAAFYKFFGCLWLLVWAFVLTTKVVKTPTQGVKESIKEAKSRFASTSRSRSPSRVSRNSKSPSSKQECSPKARPMPPPAKAMPGKACVKAMPKRSGPRNCLQVPPRVAEICAAKAPMQKAMPQQRVHSQDHGEQGERLADRSPLQKARPQQADKCKGSVCSVDGNLLRTEPGKQAVDAPRLTDPVPTRKAMPTAPPRVAKDGAEESPSLEIPMERPMPRKRVAEEKTLPKAMPRPINDGGNKRRGVDLELTSEVRFGTDLGGVLNKHLNDLHYDHLHWHEQRDSEVPHAMRSLTRVVRAFGPRNVFIISKCRGTMRRNSEIWLHDVMDICGSTGLRKENIHFCEEVSGPGGKGPIAAKLGITHFVDDSDEALASIYCDAAGNAGATIDRHHGKLFYFARSGISDELPAGHERHPRCLVRTGNWLQVLQHLQLEEDADDGGP